MATMRSPFAIESIGHLNPNFRLTSQQNSDPASGVRTLAGSSNRGGLDMQFCHLHNLLGYVSSPADSVDGSSFDSVMPQEYLLNDSGQASQVYGATAQSPASGATTGTSTSSPLGSTLVGCPGGLQFVLIS
jgi:hypothetical protein